MTEFLWVAEDLDWLRTDWWFGPSDLLTDSAVRRGAAALRLLTADDGIVAAWRHYGFAELPRVTGPNIEALAARMNLQLRLAGLVIAGGGRVAGTEASMFGTFRVDNPSAGARAEDDVGFALAQTGLTRKAEGTRLLSAPHEDLIDFSWSLPEYLGAPGLVRSGFLISRRSVIDYFASTEAHETLPETDPEIWARPDSRPSRDETFALIRNLKGKAHFEDRDGVLFELLSIGQALGASTDLALLAARIREHEASRRRLSPPRVLHERRNPSSGITMLLGGGPAAHIDPDAPFLDQLIGLNSLDQPVYRTFRMRWLREVLRSRSMALLLPSLWDDPFEDLVSRFTVVPVGRRAGQAVPLAVLRKPVYAQCWSLVDESDALWRIYSTIQRDQHTSRNTAVDDEGVRVQSSPRLLLRALQGILPGGANAESNFLGRVHYMHQREALDYVAAGVMSARESAFSGGRGHAEALLIKRESFSHEREVRLIHVADRDTARAANGLVQVPVDPNIAFRGLTLDPRLSVEDRISREEELRALGYTGPIDISKLYLPVTIRVEVD
jgi:hypothetical protein